MEYFFIIVSFLLSLSALLIVAFRERDVADSLVEDHRYSNLFRSLNDLNKRVTSIDLEWRDQHYKSYQDMRALLKELGYEWFEGKELRKIKK